MKSVAASMAPSCHLRASFSTPLLVLVPVILLISRDARPACQVLPSASGSAQDQGRGENPLGTRCGCSPSLNPDVPLQSLPVHGEASAPYFGGPCHFAQSVDVDRPALAPCPGSFQWLGTLSFLLPPLSRMLQLADSSWCSASVQLIETEVCSLVSLAAGAALVASSSMDRGSSL